MPFNKSWCSILLLLGLVFTTLRSNAPAPIVIGPRHLSTKSVSRLQRSQTTGCQFILAADSFTEELKDYDSSAGKALNPPLFSFSSQKLFWYINLSGPGRVWWVNTFPLYLLHGFLLI
jgi:hypothetical protein